MLIIMFIMWNMFLMKRSWKLGARIVHSFLVSNIDFPGMFKSVGKNSFVCINIQVVDSKFVRNFMHTPKDILNKNEIAENLSVFRIHSN